MKRDLSNRPLLKPSGRWAILAAVIAALAAGAAAFFYVFHQRGAIAPAATSVSSAHAVSALGRLQPEGEVVHLSAPTVSTELGSSRVTQLLAAEGDAVKVGQVIAILDTYERLKAALTLAHEDVKVSQANLAKVKVGAPSGDRLAQAATVSNLEAEMQGQLAASNVTIARLEAAFQNSKIEHERYQALHEAGAVTASQLDSRRLALTTAQEQLNEAKVNQLRIADTSRQQIAAAQATLNRISEVRPTDLQAAQAEVDRAIANVAKATAELELAYVRSPVAGKVLKIYTRPGERIGNQGIAALGGTEQMNVIAEVYELDIGKVRVGQRVTITSNALPDSLHGTVTQVGLQVDSQDVVSTDPAADVDRRIVEVKVRLDEAGSRQASALTNLQVDVMIDTQSSL